MNSLEFGEKKEGQFYRERKAVYGLAINCFNQVGLVKTPRGYFLPGGGLETNETLVECLKREFVEETRMDVQTYSYLGRASYYGITPIQKEYLKMIGYFFRVTITTTAESLRIIEDDHQLVWLEKDEALKLIKLEHQKWAIEHL